VSDVTERTDASRADAAAGPAGGSPADPRGRGPRAAGAGRVRPHDLLLSAKNANLTHGTDAWLGYAFAYGGLVQLLAGMWEFRNRNVFGATAFSTYGGFWIGLGLYIQLVAGNAANATQVDNDLGWILLSFAIFNTYMLLWSLRVNIGVFLVFLTLEATEIILFLSFFAGNASLTKVGGVVGIVTAAVAWFTSAALVANGMAGRPVVPVGRPIWKDRAMEPSVQAAPTPPVQTRVS
jgi:succinate-acetate transporter protein